MPVIHDEGFLKRAIAAGAGEEPADLVLKNVKLFNVIDGSCKETDIAVVGDRIVGTYGSYEGRETLDGEGVSRFRASLTRICTLNPRWSRHSNSTGACCRTV